MPPIESFLLKDLLQFVPDIIYFKDCDARFIAVSKSKALRHGLNDSAKMIGKTDADFFAEKHARHAKQDEDEIMRTGIPKIGLLEQIQWPDGRESWAVTSKLALRGASDEVIGTFGVSKDVTEIKEMEAALKQTTRELIDASRLTGVAEVATGVFHNVNNVLTSVNFSTDLLIEGIRSFKVSGLAELATLLELQHLDLAEYLANHPEFRTVPAHLRSFVSHLSSEQERLLKLGEALSHYVEHITSVINIQQNYSIMAGAIETLDPESLVEEALGMTASALLGNDILILRQYQPTARVIVEKHRVLQILVNLLRNAQGALEDVPSTDRRIEVRITQDDDKFVTIVVTDNGAGIAPETLPWLFTHGFTTRQGGHGFGLHSSARAAQALGGTLSATSGGASKGSSFTLRLVAKK